MDSQKNNKKKFIRNIIFTVIIFSAIILAFKDSFKPVLIELVHTNPVIVLFVSLFAFVYICVEGINNSFVAKRYEPAFTSAQGIKISFYNCFYKVVTFGSGSPVSAMYYLNKCGITPTIGLSITTFQYIIQKITIAFYATVCFAVNNKLMLKHYNSYCGFLLAGYGITLVIVTFLIMLCISEGFHRLLLRLSNRVLRKTKYKDKLDNLESELSALRYEAKYILKNKGCIIRLFIGNMIKLSVLYSIPFIILYGKSNFTLFDIISVTSFVNVLTGVLPTPAGIGSTEVVYTLMFSALFENILAASSMLIYRFASYIFPFMIGGILVLINHKRHAL